MSAPTLDLIAALHSYYENNVNERGDEDAPHVSDLYGCLRAVWARRNGYILTLHDPVTRMKFALGNAVEEHVATALSDRLAKDGWRLERDVVVDLGGIVGHVDFVLRHDEHPPIVVEVKSTSFLRGKVPTEAREHYQIQAAGYALALGAPRFVILVICRESGRVAEFWYTTELFRELIERRAADVRAYTAPGTPEPAAEPFYSWQCSYCLNVGCARWKQR